MKDGDEEGSGNGRHFEMLGVCKDFHARHLEKAHRGMEFAMKGVGAAD